MRSDAKDRGPAPTSAGLKDTTSTVVLCLTPMSPERCAESASVSEDYVLAWRDRTRNLAPLPFHRLSRSPACSLWPVADRHTTFVLVEAPTGLGGIRCLM